MEQEKRYSILDELAKCSGYDIALMTTFNFEIDFFERAVLNRLYAGNVKTVSVFVDSKQLTDALNEFDVKHNGSNIGRKYVVNPIKLDGSFHPKVFLLLGEKKARLFVGSANIKTSGFLTNNEVFNFIDYDTNHPEYLDVIVSAIGFFSVLNDMSYKLDNAVLQSTKDYTYYHRAGKNGEVTLLHNLKTPILEQIREIVQGEVNCIQIAVPYYDKDLLALQQIKERFPNANVSLFVQNRSSTFPVELNEKGQIVQDVRVFSRFLDNENGTSGNFYHGKVFLFKTKERSYVLYGSANCTLSALTKTCTNGGNVECDFLEAGDASAFDYFFDNMNLEVEEKLTSQKMIFEPVEPKVFFFKYGEVKGKQIELYIGCGKKTSDIVVRCEGQELKYKISNDEIVAYIDEECGDHLTEIFEISITVEKYSEVLRCWVINPVSLANYRIVQDRQDDLSDFEIESVGDKFIEDRRKILDAELTSYADVKEYRNTLKYANQIRMEQEIESEEQEDFVVDYQIPDEYRRAYRQYNATSKIRSMFVQRFLRSPLGFNWDYTEEQEKSVTKTDFEHVSITKRKATSAELSFSRFVKSKVNGMMNEVFVDIIETDHYVGLVRVVLEILKKYSDKERVEEMFSPEYIVQTRVGFMRNLVSKSTESISNRDEMEHAIIRDSLQTILETYLYYRKLSETEERLQFESMNRRLLGALEGKYKLRESYKEILKEIIRAGKGGVLTLGFEGSCKYIEELYGYKSYEMLCQTISDVYPEAEIIVKGTTLRISAKTDSIGECGKPDTDVLREIVNYSRHVTKITAVCLVFENIAPNPENKNVVIKAQHDINLDYHQWRYSTIRLNGVRFDSKSAYLSF